MESGKENLHFPSHKEGQLKVIDFPFKRGSIFYIKGIDKAPISPEHDSMFKSLEPLDYDVGKAKTVEYRTSSFLFPISHYLESSSSDSLIPGHMISSNNEPFPPPKYSVKERPP